MKRICVTGGNGLLGTRLISTAEGRYRLALIDLQDGPLVHTDGLNYIQGDITNAPSIRKCIVGAEPDCVINAAAFTDVDGCEFEREKAWAVNVEGARNVALVCRELKIKMIHISTDYIFDGKDGPYGEDDIPNPIGYYGKTKLESEGRVQEILDDAVIARTMVLYGYTPGVRPNFVTWLIGKLNIKERVTIVDDQFGTPTLADDLAKALMVLYEKDGRGVYNTAGSECLSRYDFAVTIADIFGFDKSLIEPITTAGLKQAAPRPLRSGLKIDKIRREMDVSFYTASEGIHVLKKQMVNEENHPAESS
jgi:dTDP-4-dehydrorhamnose reductase